MYNATTDETYLSALAFSQTMSDKVRDATTSADELRGKIVDAYISTDGLSGFAIAAHGELVGVFSLVKGRGAELMRHAIYRGAHFLDCFDGYLTSFYASHGFVEVARVQNWTPGGPDVVYMALATDISEVYA